MEKSKQQTKCEQGRQRSKCKDCGGSEVCEHNKRKSQCKDCGGSQICEHNKRRSHCKDCGRGHICEHNKRRSRCKDCTGGEVCEHNKIKSISKDCGGGHICKHNKERSAYSMCDPLGHLAGVIRCRVYIALKNDKEMSSTDYLECNFETFKKQIEQNSQKVCHGKIMVNGTSIIRYR